jgi:hypothetical protein
MKNTHVVESPIDLLTASATRAIGLMHLLAVAAAKTDKEPYQPPTPEEEEGILWLSMSTGEDLKAAVEAMESERNEGILAGMLAAESTRYVGMIPGLRQAAKALGGVDVLVLYSVITGERENPSLLGKWNDWLQANPEFIESDERKRQGRRKEVV